MLLAIDVGNTNTVLGLYRGDELLRDWRLNTDKVRTVDEWSMIVRQLFALAGREIAEVQHLIIASVVPQQAAALAALGRDDLRVPVVQVGPELTTGLPIRYDNPREVGADRIVNAVAAFERCRGSVIVVDFGTATTFDYLSAQGEYLGGAIAPGPHLSAEALYHQTSKLPRVEFACPPRVIARNTVQSIQSGLLYGYVGLVDGLVDRMRAEGNEDSQVIATGGLAGLIAPHSRTIGEVVPHLTLEGLRLIFERNRCQPPNGDCGNRN
ncbi:MAG: type III pantothenate kinase [Desulfuromonadales bacterium]|nr:type III pantothenate kinase [Desulfuromonadales bacterium]